MLSTFLEQPTRASILHLDARSHNQLAAGIFGRTPRLPFSIVLTEACGVQSGESFRQLLAAVADASGEEAIHQLLTGKLTDEHLSSAKILLSGNHRVEGGFVVIGNGATVELVGHGIALVFGKASVTARGDFEIYAAGKASLTAYDRVRIDASGSVEVKAYDYVVGVARDNVRGIVHGHCQWQVSNASNFDAYDKATVTGTGQATVYGYGNSRITGLEGVRAFLNERASGWFADDTVIELSGSAVTYKTDSVRVARQIGASRILPWDRP